MKVISFLNPKGGSGKTTAVINFATALARKGLKIAVVDTDPQMSLSNWHIEEKCNFDVFTAAGENDVYSIPEDLAEYDYTVIDGAGSLSVITAAAVMVSDLVIIPVSPSPLDFSASGSVMAVLKAQSRNRKDPIHSRFLITRKVEQATMLATLKASIKDTGIPAYRTSIAQRQSYVKCLLDGETVFDTNDTNAKGEIEVLTQEILSTFE